MAFPSRKDLEQSISYRPLKARGPPIAATNIPTASVATGPTAALLLVVDTAAVVEVVAAGAPVTTEFEPGLVAVTTTVAANAVAEAWL
jgi:hypothetical protein